MAERKRPHVEGLFTDLDLNGSVPPQVVPGLGRWAPADVPSTRQKARWRWLILLVLLAALAAIVAMEAFMYKQLL